MRIDRVRVIDGGAGATLVEVCGRRRDRHRPHPVRLRVHRADHREGPLPARRRCSSARIRASRAGSGRGCSRAFGAAKGRGSESGLAVNAMAALDMAIWDLAGKVQDLPLHALLGGAVRDSIPAYASSSLFVSSSYERGGTETDWRIKSPDHLRRRVPSLRPRGLPRREVRLGQPLRAGRRGAARGDPRGPGPRHEADGRFRLPGLLDARLERGGRDPRRADPRALRRLLPGGADAAAGRRRPPGRRRRCGRQHRDGREPDAVRGVRALHRRAGPRHRPARRGADRPHAAGRRRAAGRAGRDPVRPALAVVGALRRRALAGLPDGPQQRADRVPGDGVVRGGLHDGGRDRVLPVGARRASAGAR